MSPATHQDGQHDRRDSRWDDGDDGRRYHRRDRDDD
jgi:hypothetical protein